MLKLMEHRSQKRPEGGCDPSPGLNMFCSRETLTGGQTDTRPFKPI